MDEAGRKISLTYDADNHLTNISINGKERLKNRYDKNGNLLATENAEGSRVTITYGEDGRPQAIKAADGATTTLTYDNHGNITAITDVAGAQTAYTYDDLNRVTRTTDANGNATSYIYDEADRIIAVTNAAGSTRTYTYNESGKLTALTDYDGYEITAAYNVLNRIETLTDKEGNETRYTYDRMWDVASEITPDGVVRRYIYNKDNRLSSIELPQGGSVTYTYDPNGNRTGITDAEGNHTAFLYDAANRLTEVTEPYGAKTRYAYDEDGNLSGITDALGHTWHYTYDFMGRRTSETDPLGNTISVLYNAMGKIDRVCYPNGSSMTYTYGAGGKLTAITRPDGTGEHYAYDPNGNLVKKENSLGEALSMEYDCLNRVIAVTNPMGGVRRYAYDTVGHVTALTDENGNTTAYTYSPNGNLTKVVDALGNETCYTYDCSGHLAKVERKGSVKGMAEERRADGENLAGMQTGANPVEAWNRNSDIDAGGQPTPELIQTTTYTWNPSGSLAAMTDPLGNTEYYTYDKNGRMTEKTDRDGYMTAFAYDHAGKVTDILYADGRSVKFSYNALHQLEQVKDWHGSMDITLDALGRPLSVTDPYGQTVGYEWNHNGARTEMIYPDGMSVHYEYDSSGRLSTLTEGLNRTSYVYHENGELAEKVLPNGIHTAYQYNASGRLESLVHTGGEITEGFRFSYDANGNKIRVVREINGEIDVDGSYGYEYDAMNRLVGVTRGEKTLRTYSYDVFGNRIEKCDFTEERGLRTTYRYNANNQLIYKSGSQPSEMASVYRYDRRGNMLSVIQGERLQKQFEFDAANRLGIAVDMSDGRKRAAKYCYNGLGQRIGQEIYAGETKESLGLSSNISFGGLQPENQFQYLSDITRGYNNLLEQTDTVNGRKQSFVWDTNVIGMREAGEEYFYLQDAGGSVMYLTDRDRHSREHYEFDEFGLPQEDNPGVPMQPFAFAGYQFDAVCGVYYAQARRYDADAGRFISEDKLGGMAEAPYTQNRYIYCWNRPMDLVDLNGLFPEWLERILRGIKAHQVLEQEFEADYGSKGGQTEFNIESGIPWSVTGTGRADIVYFNGSTKTVEVYDIKPESYMPGAAYNLLGLAQVDGYIKALRSNGQIINGWEIERGSSLNTYFDMKTITVQDGLFKGEEITYRVYENGMVIYHYQEKDPQESPQTDSVPAELKEESPNTVEKAILLTAAVISMIGGIVLYADDIPTAGAGIPDDGAATALVKIAIELVKMALDGFVPAFAENGNQDNCSYS